MDRSLLIGCLWEDGGKGLVEGLVRAEGNRPVGCGWLRAGGPVGSDGAGVSGPGGWPGSVRGHRGAGFRGEMVAYGSLCLRASQVRPGHPHGDVQ